MKLGKRRWIGLGLLGFLILLLLWLLFSGSGLRTVMRQVPGLSFEQLEGRLVGPLQAQQLRWSDPAVALQIDGLQTDYRFGKLMLGDLWIPELVVQRLTIQLLAPTGAPPEPFRLSEWRLRLPPLELPMDIDVGRVQLEQLRILDADGAVVLDGRVDTGAIRVVDGRLSLTELRLEAVDQGSLQASLELDSRSRWRGQARLRADLDDAHGWRAEMDLQGDLDAATIALRASGALDAELDLTLRALDSAPAWTLALTGTRAAAAEAGTEALTWQLEGHGERGRGALSGELQQGAQRVSIVALPFALSDALDLQIDAGRVLLDGQTSADVALDGHWPLAEGAPDGALEIGWNGLRLAANATAAVAPTAEPVSAEQRPPRQGALLRSGRGTLRLSGRVDAYAIVLDAPLQYGDDGGLLKLEARGDRQRLEVVGLTLDSEFGQAELAGQLQFEPLAADLAVDVQGLRPDLFAPGFAGVLRLQGQLRVAVDGARTEGRLAIAALSGSLREAAIGGSGELVWAGGELPVGELALSWGSNRIDYERADGGAALLNVDARQLDLLVAELGGRLNASLNLPARIEDWPLAHGSGELRQLRLGGAEGSEIELTDVDISRAAGQAQPLLLEARGLKLAGQGLDRLTLSLQPGELWVVQSRASGPQLELTLEGTAEQRDGQWQGSLVVLELAQGDWPRVELQAPAAWRWAQPQGALDSACLGIESGRLCVAGSVDEAGMLQLQITPGGLDLSLLNPALRASGVQLGGLLEGAMQLQWSSAQGVAAIGELFVADLLATLPGLEGTERLEKRAALELRLQAPDDDDPRQRIEALLDFAELGKLTLQLAGQPLTDAPDWDVALRSGGLDLLLIDGVHPELVGPRGQLAADLQLRQRLGQWSGEGLLSLSEGALELPLAGLQLAQLTVQLEATPSGEFRLSGTGRSGEGRFELAGTYPIDPAADADLSIKGDKVLVANLPIVRMEASPDLQVSRRAGKVGVKGNVLIPSALIDLARFEPSVQASSDVVVVDDPPQESGLPLAVNADIRLEMGESVRLRGFGLDGRLSGALSVRERPGRPPTGRGELNVTGQYRAYGQDLTISRGKLLFSGGPLDNPGLDLLAVREIGAIEAGVRVRGAAERPELSVYSDPPMDQAEAFSYLVLGRPLSSASGDDSQQLGAAAAALGSAAGGLLASKLGSGTGLAVEVESSADLGGAALTVGRYITPEIYFGIGRSLFDDIQVAILRYKLTSSIELEALSGAEFKGGVNYRLEK